MFKKIILLATIVASLCMTTISAQATEFEAADYLAISTYTEVMKPANETDGTLSVSVEGEAGEDGYLYLIETVKGMELAGEISGENISGDLEAVSIGSINYYRVKAADPSSPVSVKAEFTCVGFYAPTPTADTNGGNNYPISYKFTNYLDSAIGKYKLTIFAPEGNEIVKVTTPAKYASFTLGESDGMRSVSVSGAVKSAASSSLEFTYNVEASSMQNVIVWVVCLAVGGAVLIDRLKKARQ